MKRNLILTGLFLLGMVTLCAAQTRKPIYYLDRVTVVDVIRGTKAPGMAVLLTGGTIAAIGKPATLKPPRGARVIDCRGKYLIPGLWDMHVHLGNATAAALPLFVANGITGVRDMGTGSFDSIRSWRAGIEARRTIGPRIVSSGPILNGGKPTESFQVGVNSPEEANRIVDSMKKIGVDFIKVHGGLSREVYFAIANAAKSRGLSYSGHVPASSTNVSVTGEEASEAGQRSLEHLIGVPFAPGDTVKAYQSIYPSQESLDRLFATLRKNGTYVTPTLMVYEIPPNYAAIVELQTLKLPYIAKELIAFWNRQTRDWAKRDKAFMTWLAGARRRMVPLLNNAGVPLLAGTDTGFPYVMPGFGLHDELGYLVAAGLSPLDALRAATINPARFLGREHQTGSIDAGKSADLVVLDADPLADIANTRKIRAVIAGGELFDRSALEKMMESLRTKTNATR